MKLNLLFLVILEHTVAVEHAGVLHLFNEGAWLWSLGHKDKKTPMNKCLN